MWKKLIILGLAGALGTLCRYGVSGVAHRLLGDRFPWGTFAVNTAGCFLFGIIWVLADERLVVSGQTRLILLTGFMGAFTTFSTFGFETSQFMRDAQWWHAAGNVLANNVVGLLAVFVGYAVGRWF